jgi:hypothetical protein
MLSRREQNESLTIQCSYIDKGINPDLFIKEMRSSGLHETEQVKSKMVSLAVRIR